VYLTSPLKGFPWNWISAKGSEETRMMELPEVRISFKIALAILIQYRRVTDSQPASHVAVASTCYAYLRHAVINLTTNEFYHLPYGCSFDVVFVTESWLTSKFPNSLLDPNSKFTIFQHDRLHSRGVVYAY